MKNTGFRVNSIVTQSPSISTPLKGNEFADLGVIYRARTKALGIDPGTPFILNP